MKFSDSGGDLDVDYYKIFTDLINGNKTCKVK